MLRVLTLSTLFPDATRPQFGGFVARQTHALAMHPDVEVQVVAPVGLPPWPLSLARHYRALTRLPAREDWTGLTVHRPRFLHVPATMGRFDARALERSLLPFLRRIRDSFAFDVIDAEFFFPDGPAAVALGRALGVPVSIKARGSDIHFWGKAEATAAQVRDAGREADGVLAVSAALKQDMVRLGMPEDRIAVHYTGIDQTLFAPGQRTESKAQLGVSGPLVVTVGTLNENKGQALVIDAVRALENVTLVLIGTGPDRAELEARSRDLGGRVRFTGSIPHAEIARWLGAADVMCLPSASEGLSNAWIEALASGTPIVITDVGGAREVLTDPSCGRILAERTPEAITNAVAELLASSPDPHAVSALARRFSWDANRDALYAHLSRLSARKSLPSG